MKFSIIIPTYNRPRQLRACLESLAKLNYPKENFEVIVVDDGGQQPLDEIVQETNKDLSTTLVVQSNRGCGLARNTGVAQAQGDYVIFLDDDYVLAADWLSQFERSFQTYPDAMVGGFAHNLLTDNIYSEASQILNEIVYKHYNRSPDNARFHTGGNMAMKRTAFLEAGGFDARFTKAGPSEDRDFCAKWLRQGRQIVFNPAIKLYHAHHLTLRSFWKQHFNYARGAYLFRQNFLAQSSDGRYPIEWRLHWLIWTYGLRLVGRMSAWDALRVQLLLYLQQVATVVGTVWARYEARKSSAQKRRADG